MNTKIKFIRAYEMYGHPYFDIVYKTWRVTTRTPGDLPTTAQKFLESAISITAQYDNVYKRNETIYK